MRLEGQLWNNEYQPPSMSAKSSNRLSLTVRKLLHHFPGAYGTASTPVYRHTTRQLVKKDAT